MKFKQIIKRERKSQSFDIDRTIKKGNKTFKVYDAIQEAREDTEIYPTLEKYGCIEKLVMDTGKVYADFRAFKDLKNMQDQQKAAMELWNSLPYDVRKEFNNNMHTFADNGEEYLKKKLAEQQKETIATEEPKETVATSQGE